MRYVELLKAYTAIKANCPGMVVVSGAPTPAGMVLPNAFDDRVYLTSRCTVMAWHAMPTPSVCIPAASGTRLT